jgi:N-acetylglutamate synthase-like GNAT family acetyltransferase
MDTDCKISVASCEHVAQAESICRQMAQSALGRGTGIAGRTPAYVRQKMLECKAVIAMLPDGKWAGFAYLDIWEGGAFVSQSGLIVEPDCRQHGVARQLKYALFTLSRQLFPKAKIFSITTSQAVMTINTQLGFRPVAFSELPQETPFWAQCNTCQNCDILARTGKKYCLCTGMLFDPAIAAPTPALVTKTYACRS